MRKRIAPATPPVGSYRNIPYFALRGVFRQRGYRDQEVAEALGMKPPTLSRKMGGHAEWSSSEIEAICELLEIPQKDVGKFFFPRMQKGA